MIIIDETENLKRWREAVIENWPKETDERPQLEDFVVTLSAFLFSLGLAVGAISMYLVEALR